MGVSERVCNSYITYNQNGFILDYDRIESDPNGWKTFFLSDEPPSYVNYINNPISCVESITIIDKSTCSAPIGIWNGKNFESCNYTFTNTPEGSPQSPTFTPEPEPFPVIVPDISYYIHDHLGNTRIIYNTDRKCGEDHLSYNAEYMADYYPYGKILREYTVGKPEKYLTTHHERDRETGLDYRGARFYDSDIGRFLSVDPLAEDYASWSPYNYVLGNPVMLVDPDGRAPENIIIRVNSNNEDSYGHAAIAVEEYDSEGNKTGNVVVYEVAGAPSGGDGEYKNSVVFGQGVTPDYSVEVMEKSAFLSQSQEGYDGIVEIETTKDQDQDAHSSLQGTVDDNTPYNPVSNNCSSLTCQGLRSAGVVTSENFGQETAKKGLGPFGIERTFNTPNAVFNDAAKLPNANVLKNPGDKTKSKFQEYIDKHY